jgi:non-heme chloroperoxidase
MYPAIRWMSLVVLGFTSATTMTRAEENDAFPEPQAAVVGGGVELHYVERGEGVPVLFIHGGLEDYTTWKDQVWAFGESYRAIAYSRRYNFPNTNTLRPNHSASVEAEDLAALMQKLSLKKSHIIGFSYGGTTALFLAVRHPELVRTLTLAEPAAAPWLANMSGPGAKEGKDVLARYMERLMRPARLAFENDNLEGALRITIDYLIGDGKYDDFPEHVHSMWMRNMQELKAVVISPNGLAVPDRKHVRNLKMPVLLLSGEKSAPSCQLTDVELQAVLPKGLWQRVVFDGCTHAMWLENPEECRYAVLEFLRGK